MTFDDYVQAQATALGLTVSAYGPCAEAAALEGVAPEDFIQSRAEASGMDFESYCAHLEDAAVLGLSGDAYSMIYHLAYANGVDCATYISQQAYASGVEEGVYKSIATVAAAWQTTPDAVITAAASAGVPAAEYAEMIAAGTAAPPPATPPPALAENAAGSSAVTPASEVQQQQQPTDAVAGEYSAPAEAVTTTAMYAPPTAGRKTRRRSSSGGKKSPRMRGKKGKFSCNDPALQAAWLSVKDDADSCNWFLMSYDSELGAFAKKDVELLGRGAGGYPELYAYLADDRIIWGGFRCTSASDGTHGVPKYVFLTWVGQDIPSTRAAVVGTETHIVRAAFRGSHHTVTIRHRDEGEIEALRSNLEHFFAGSVNLNVAGWQRGEGAGATTGRGRRASWLAAVEEANEKTRSGSNAGASSASSTPKVSTSATSAVESAWESRLDPASGVNFYWNRETGATTWDISDTDLPHDASSSSGDEASGSDSDSDSEDGPLPPDWSAVMDPATNTKFYHNAVTGESSWTIPSS
jgi:hypothetical protein